MIRLLVLALFVHLSAHASLLDIFPYSNTNRPEIWQDQLGGFATGGSIHVRTPSTSLQMMHLDLPSFKGGCGGIDLFGGGFGYINKSNLEVLIKNIGTTALSYSVMLTIKSLSGQVSDLIENLEAMARFINGQNINSCQMGASIAAGLFPKTEASNELACNARKMGSQDVEASKIANYFTARYECQDSTKRFNANKEDSNLLGSEYNLVWKALAKMLGTVTQQTDASGQQKPVDNTRADKEFLMSLSGTLIAKKDSFEHKNSLIKNSQILDTIVFGSSANTINLYQCDAGPDCLNPSVVTETFTPERSVLHKVRTLLASIGEKIIQENAGSSPQLTETEKYLATTTSIPIIKLIALNAASKGHGINLTIEDYAETVAFDYVVSYLDSLLDFVYLALANLEHTQLDGEKIKNFKEEIRHVKQMLYFERVKAFERLNTLLSVKVRAQAIEKTVLAHFIEYRS